MFILRSVTLDDLNDLHELSQLMVFINLPSDRAILQKKIECSIKSFADPSPDLSKNFYLFGLEDTSVNKIIGVSMIHAKHGTEEEPHFFLKVSREHKYSHSLNMGFIHGTLKLGVETDGWSEVGGLVLDPSYRNNPFKLGKQLSFVRFLYMALNKNSFTDIIHSELMPPFNSKGESLLWEAIGRRFMNMNYHDADILSRKNKEFILNLYPSETIYETLLSLEAKNTIGKVGEKSRPVKKMLESIGFQYTEEVDPFDGGPHFRARLDDITLVSDLFHAQLNIDNNISEKKNFLITGSHRKEPFLAVMIQGRKDNNQGISISEESMEKFNLKRGMDYSIIEL